MLSPRMTKLQSWSQLSIMLSLNPLLGSGTRSLRAVAGTSRMSLVGIVDQSISTSGWMSPCNSETTGSGGALTVRGCAMASTLLLVLTPISTQTSTPILAPMRAGGRRGRLMRILNMLSGKIWLINASGYAHVVLQLQIIVRSDNH